jgi:hypothetical protein
MLLSGSEYCYCRVLSLVVLANDSLGKMSSAKLITLTAAIPVKMMGRENIDENAVCPLWSTGQSSWPLTQRSRDRFPALPDFLSSSGSGTVSSQPL